MAIIRGNFWSIMVAFNLGRPGSDNERTTLNHVGVTKMSNVGVVNTLIVALPHNTDYFFLDLNMGEVPL
jgi:hypothetical protein